ncbi:MAG: hypothetical protein H7840_10570 [Alphaproteobacteria bacterium]
MTTTNDIRQAIIKALPIETSNFGHAPQLEHIYVPMAHLKALRLDCALVVGGRGTGKSFWTAALDSSQLRGALGKDVGELERTEVRIGYSGAPNIKLYPDPDTFKSLITEEVAPYDIWRAVTARWLRDITGEIVPAKDWKDTVAWVRNQPEKFARLAENANATMQQRGEYGLIVFDALDRLSSNWVEMDRIVRDLLRLLLWLKPFSCLHGKVFLREDQSGDRVTNFTDASKLVSTRADLAWAPHDLHGLLWQMLCNAQEPHGSILREIYEECVGVNPKVRDGKYFLSDEVKREGGQQRKLFEALAGPWMGPDRRRGVPYVWSVSHLADGKQRTSPRSFLAAIRKAAEDSSRYTAHEFALHYESIKRGVQEASKIRVDELAEDYPWVNAFVKPLQGLSVPCEFAALEDRWRDAFPGGPLSLSQGGLPPPNAARGWQGVCDDLVRLGILEIRTDRRINMPDLFRVAFGLGRRGGIKTVRLTKTGACCRQDVPPPGP